MVMRALVSEKSQLGLFSGAVENLKVRPHPVGDEDEALAAALPSQLYLGTSFWDFTGWRGILLRARYRGERPLGMVYGLMLLGIGYAVWGLTEAITIRSRERIGNFIGPKFLDTFGS